MHDQVGVARLHGVRDRVEVARALRVDLLVDGFDPGRLQLRLDALQGHRRERVVKRWIRGGFRAFALRKADHPVRPKVALAVRRGLLREKEELEPPLEELRRTTGRLDEEHPVAFGNRRRRSVEQRGEGPQ
jgi:hypothetical protein